MSYENEWGCPCGCGCGRDEWAREQPLRELIRRALAQVPQPEPQPSDEEVEAVFRAVVASYYG